MNKFYRDVALPMNVAKCLVDDYGYSQDAADKLVEKHKTYVRKAFNAYPVPSAGGERLIAATVTQLRGGKHHSK